MRLVFQIRNPFFRKSRENKDYFYKHWTLSTNKSAEIQISKFDHDRLIDCTIDLHWWGDDHAGPKIDFSLLGYMFTANIYDHRHWDYDNHRWEQYNADEDSDDVD